MQGKFKFIDLFAGIGGFHLAMKSLGGECVFASEINEDAKEIYNVNHGLMPHGDITLEETKEAIPAEFDLLCAGFPCQAFSNQGKRKGFEDARGTLFFEIADIIKRRQPKAVLLENVKGLASHDKGKTLATILGILRDDLDYYVPEPRILNACDFGVPQLRPRIFIVAFNKNTGVDEFSYPEPTGAKAKFADVKDMSDLDRNYWLTAEYVKNMNAHKARNAEAGNGFGYNICPDDGLANTITVGGFGLDQNWVIDKRLTDFSPVGRKKGDLSKECYRYLTPRECARLQGYPDEFKMHPTIGTARKQFGNSVAIPCVVAMGKQILAALDKAGADCNEDPLNEHYRNELSEGVSDAKPAPEWEPFSEQKQAIDLWKSFGVRTASDAPKENVAKGEEKTPPVPLDKEHEPD